MSKFEIGKWYSWTQQGRYKHYGKVKTIPSSNTIYISPWIINQKTYDEEGCFDQQNSTEIKEISIDVVRQFLPVGHPDLEGVKSSSSNLTELPEKWCIRIATKEINDAINRKGLYPSLELYWEDSPNYTTYYVTSGELYLSSKPNDHVELTEDQFKKWVLKEETPDTPRFKFKVGDEVNYINSKVTAVSNGLEGGWLSSSDVTHRMVESCHHSEVVGNCYKIGALYVSEVGLALKPQKLAEPPNPNTTEQWTPKVGEWVVGWFCETKPENYHKNAWQIGEIKNGHYYVKGKVSHCTDKTNLRKALPHEIPSPQERLNAGTVTPGELYMEMSGLSFKKPEESLLEEAKRRYPVGCKVKSFGYGEFVVDHHKEPQLVSGEVWIYGKLKGSNGDVYKNGHWAEIIEEPKTHPEYVECVESWHPVAWTTGKIYRTEDKQTNFPETLSLKCDRGDVRDVCKWNELPKGFKPSTREAYERQEGISNIGVSSSVGLGGSRDFLTSGTTYFNGASVGVINYPKGVSSISYIGSKGSTFNVGIDPWLFEEKVLETSLKPQPCPKITVKSHEEFKITISKPKQIKL